MHLIAKAVRISHAKLHCNRLTAVQDIQDNASLIFGGTQCTNRKSSVLLLSFVILTVECIKNDAC